MAFNGLAGIVEQYLDRGDEIAITGHLVANAWIAKDGTKKFSVEIHADKIDFLRLKRRDRPEPVNTDQGGYDEDIPF